jgi:hypothetical protein
MVDIAENARRYAAAKIQTYFAQIRRPEEPDATTFVFSH